MSKRRIRLVVPKGRMYGAVLDLLEQAGLTIPRTEKNYRPRASDPGFEVKLMKAANIPTLVELGKHDIGFSGRDWVRESAAEVETLLDTRLLPVRLVAAAPLETNPFEDVTGRPMVVASEYERLTREYMERRGADWRFIRTYGDPVLTVHSDQEASEVETLLFRHPTDYFTSDRVYATFDESGKLISWEHKPYQKP